MKWIAVIAMLGGSMPLATQAEARGCIRGAIVGGIAGHFAGHHGLMGAAAGCAVGHHIGGRQNQPQQYQGDSQPATPPPAQ